jgi:hypothetical protein
MLQCRALRGGESRVLGDNYPDRSHWITGNVTHEFPLPHE